MKINIFGNGEVFRQIKPLLEELDISVEKVVWDENDNSPEEILKQSQEEVLFCVGYQNLEKRLKRLEELIEKKIKITNFLARNAIVSTHSELGKGIIVNQGAIIDNFVRLEDGVFVNIGAMISHDTSIGKGSFLAPGVNIAGFVQIGTCCFIGSNATIINNIKIGNHVVVAAGAVVIDDIPDNVMVAGNPAIVKKLR